MHFLIKSSSLLKISRYFHTSFSTANKMSLTETFSAKSFNGYQKFFAHYSEELTCNMKFAIYLPPNADKTNKVPVLYWLTGITNDEESFPRKAGAQRYASQHNLCIVCPDSSPRNVDIPGQDDREDFGSGAGFYVNATQSPWSKHYRMYSYITKELLNLIEENFPVIPGKRSIAGHSMGGHGALVCALKNPGLYCSVSALEPIANPVNSPISQRAFKGYLGDNMETWREWDATELVKNYKGIPIELFFEQGTNDIFYDGKELLPENLIEAVGKNDLVRYIFKWRDGYDHSHYYVSSVIEEHIKYHMHFLK